MKIFFTADLHFWHNNVIEYDNRPYSSVEEMNEDIIKRWNKTVSKDDIVWVLGDIALTTNKEKLTNVITRLNGRKRLILGNHDNCTDDFYRSAGFEFVSKYPIVLHDFFILSHEPPQFMTEKAPFFYIYGHVHNSEAYQTYTEHSACVSITRHDYKPVEIPAYYKFIEEHFDGMGSRIFSCTRR